MKKKIFNYFLVAVMLLTGMSTFVACKDYDEESYNELKSQLNSEMTLRQALEAQLAALKEQVAGIKSCTCDLSLYLSKNEAALNYETKAAHEASIALLQEAIDKINATIGYVDTSKGTVAEQLSELNSAIILVQQLAEKAMEEAKKGKCTCDLSVLQKQIDALNELVAGWNDKLKEVNKTALKAVADVAALEALVKDNYATKEELAAAKKEAMDKAEEALKLAKEALEKASGDPSAKIGEIEKKLDSFISEYQPKIDQLIFDVATIQKTISCMQTKIKSLIQDLLKKQIVDVTVQATQSPVIGYLNTPFDVRSNILAAYYGEINAQMEFPSTSSADYVNGSTDFAMWTSRNIDIIGTLTSVPGYFTQGAGRFVGTVDGNEEGNAGTLYLTINPNTVNFEGVTLNLETSQENQAPVMLSPLAYSSRELTMGYTRSANNGFYEAKATLSESDIDKAKLNIDYKTLEEDAKAMLKERTKNSIIQMGIALIQNIKDVMPAYGVKASWTDETEGNVHNLLSEYSLGACAVKPLSFSFMKDYNFGRFPGMGRLQTVVGHIVDDVKVKLNHNLPDYSKYAGSVTFKDINLTDKNIKLVYNISEKLGSGNYIVVTNSKGKFALVGPNGQLYHVNGSTLTAFTTGETQEFGTYDEELKIDFTDEIQKLVDELNEQWGASSDNAQNITDLLNDVSKLSQIDTNIATSVAETKENIKATLNSYITRANNKMTGWLNNAHKSLYITLIGGVDKKIGMLSQALSLPTQVSGELTLVPTSWTLELLAPAYKKYVAVTDVFDSSKNPVDLATAKSMAASANGGENMNQVIDGDKTCKMTGESGYIYEITYTAVDFHGKVAIKKFYVQF